MWEICFRNLALILSSPDDFLFFIESISFLVSCSFVFSRKKEFSSGFVRYFFNAVGCVLILFARFLPMVQK